MQPVRVTSTSSANSANDINLKERFMARIPTPIVDGYLENLDAETSQAIAEMDAVELAQERANVSPRVAERLEQPDAQCRTATTRMGGAVHVPGHDRGCR